LEAAEVEAIEEVEEVVGDEKVEAAEVGSNKKN